MAHYDTLYHHKFTSQRLAFVPALLSKEQMHKMKGGHKGPPFIVIA